MNQGRAELNRLLVLNFPHCHWSIRCLHLLAAVVTLPLLDLPIVRQVGAVSIVKRGAGYPGASLRTTLTSEL